MQINSTKELIMAICQQKETYLRRIAKEIGMSKGNLSRIKQKDGNVKPEAFIDIVYAYGFELTLRTKTTTLVITNAQQLINEVREAVMLGEYEQGVISENTVDRIYHGKTPSLSTIFKVIESSGYQLIIEGL